jgi:HD-GYP domain-containing protein (c-di-GMP phosphodiesterase class II)
VFDGENHKLADHAMQMAMLGMAIGIEMGLDAENIRTIGVAGLVCDWGMTRLPKRIRDSETILTEVEFFEIKKHPLYTLEILEKMSGIPRLVPMVVYQIHERPNGTGYPSGRCEGGIHQFSSILHIADAYTSLITEKPYRRALMPYAAMECLIKQARTKDVDAEIVRTLLHVLSLFPIGSFVSLSNGSVARVLRRNGHKYTSPILEIVQDADGMKPDGPAENAVLDPSETGINIVQAIPTPGRHEVSLTEEILDLRQ